MITYKPLVETLKKRNKTIFQLQEELQNPRLRQTLNSNRYVNTQTIDKICQLLHCKVNDVIAYEPGEQDIKDIQYKNYVTVNWTKLQLRCEELRTSFSKMSIRMDHSKSYLSSMSRKPHIGLNIAKEIATHFNYQLEDILQN